MMQNVSGEKKDIAVRQNLLDIGVSLVEKQLPTSKLSDFGADSDMNAAKVCVAPSVKASIIRPTCRLQATQIPHNL